jgi:hypothetical protein
MNKLFPSVWSEDYKLFSAEQADLYLKKSPHYLNLNYQSNDELRNLIIDTDYVNNISEHYLFFETNEYKIYLFKFNTHDAPNLIKTFLMQVTKMNVDDKKIIFINPT